VEEYVAVLNDQATLEADPSTATPAPAETPARRSVAGRVRRRRGDLAILAVVMAIVAVAAQLPVIRTHIFYYWDDSAAVFMPSWRLIGEQLLQGVPPFLNVDVWMGGNFAGEAQLGVFNPVMMANAVMTALLPDLALAAVIVKTEFLVFLAAGIYLLAREYGARPAAAAVVAVALPFSGYTLFWDAASWAASLIAFSFLPHVWWTMRRFARGRLHPVVPLAAGALTMTVGSPYGALGVIVVLFVVAVERLVQGDRRSILRLAIVGLAAGLTGAVTFLPLLGMQAVSWRAQGAVYNGTQLVPGLGQLLNLSAPSYVPPIATFRPQTTPMAYLSWFVVPLLPWFAWSTLARIRARVGILVFGGVYLLLALGPSNLWLFRWPARLIEYVYLAVSLLVALLLTAGLRTDRSLRRGLVSAGLIAVETYLTWANRPDTGRRAVEAAAVVAIGVALVLLANRYRSRLVAPTLIAGTIGVLAMQLHWFPANLDVTPWRFPHNVAKLRADFADRTDGNTLTVADPYLLPPGSAQPNGAWREILFGNLNQVAGMPSLNSYTGMGNQKFGDALCMVYHGGVCPEAYERIFAVDPRTGRPLADLLRLRSVVVVNGYLQGNSSVNAPPPGWEISRRTDLTTTLRRGDSLPYPDGRVSWAEPSVTVTADHASGSLAERVRYTGGGTLMVAALAWPGWHATVDGKAVPVQQGPAGLIQVDLPQSNAESTVRLWFWPSGLRQGAELLTLGVLIGVGYCVVYSVQRRRRRVTGDSVPGRP
jgi:hypothetical protein